MTSKPGALAEKLAEKYLISQGLRLIKRNWRCRMGEIDLICREGNCLVFVEVRLRTNSNFGGPAASITRTKQTRLLRAARQYLVFNPAANCRFDAILLSALNEHCIEWIRNAFDAAEY